MQFGTTTFGAVMTDISGMRLDYDGVIKEFPDLKDKEDWKQEAVKRFKDKIIIDSAFFHNATNHQIDSSFTSYFNR